MVKLQEVRKVEVKVELAGIVAGQITYKPNVPSPDGTKVQVGEMTSGLNKRVKPTFNHKV